MSMECGCDESLAVFCLPANSLGCSFTLFAHFLPFSFTHSPSHWAAIQQVGSRQSGLYLISKCSLSLSPWLIHSCSLIHALSLRLLHSVRFPPFENCCSELCVFFFNLQLLCKHNRPHHAILHLCFISRLRICKTQNGKRKILDRQHLRNMTKYLDCETSILFFFFLKLSALIAKPFVAPSPPVDMGKVIQSDPMPPKIEMFHHRLKVISEKNFVLIWLEGETAPKLFLNPRRHWYWKFVTCERPCLVCTH